MYHESFDLETDDPSEVEGLSLIESLDEEWIKLPLAAMQEVGPAVQTLGGLLNVTNRETFSALRDIALSARVPMPTCRKHLATLDKTGWIKYEGRQPTRAGHLRRTVTINITAKTKNHLKPYGVLPWWAGCRIGNIGRLPWSARAVLSVIMARLMSLKAAVECQDGHGLEADDIIGSIANMGDDRRFRFSLGYLIQQTGLTHDSVTAAKRRLHQLHIVDRQCRHRDDGGTDTDLLVPNSEFQVVKTPAEPGHFYLHFEGDAKSGQ